MSNDVGVSLSDKGKSSVPDVSTTMMTQTGRVFPTT